MLALGTFLYIGAWWKSEYLGSIGVYRKGFNVTLSIHLQTDAVYVEVAETVEKRVTKHNSYFAHHCNRMPDNK